mmetsp:Transcript_136211/g.344923  ORF Transcript_136211/g.344923 Transcript_136211/m.344923 type:complete len:88 (+) Transcript_136211:99-362(+)
MSSERCQHAGASPALQTRRKMLTQPTSTARVGLPVRRAWHMSPWPGKPKRCRIACVCKTQCHINHESIGFVNVWAKKATLRLTLAFN